MGVLTRKLLRTIWGTKGQFFAVVTVVTLGVTIFIAMSTALYNLEASKNLFYEQNRFADYYFHVVKAPEQVIRQIEQVPGVAQATGRIQVDIPLLQEGNQRATARLISYPLPLEGQVNRFQLLSGRLFVQDPYGGVEILTDLQFAAANNLSLNDVVTVVADGKIVPLTVVGTATSPEFVYSIKDPATLIPDPKSFGILMIPLQQAQQLLNQIGEINQVVIRFTPGADEKRVVQRMEEILEPYGNLAAYPRDEQLSHAVLQAELDGLKVTSRFLPAIFFIVAGAIQFIMLGRMVKSQRLQIGVMKAMGYSSRQIMQHYTNYALAVGLLGAVFGTLLGVALASVISYAYGIYFNLPETISGLNTKATVYGFLLSLGVGGLSGVIASRGVTAIHPAEAMRPEVPKSSRKSIFEHWDWLWQRLEPTWKMSIRTIGRNRMRFTLVLLGITFAVGMLVVSLFFHNSIDYMVREHYEVEQRYNYLLRFTTPLKESELLNISRIDGVLQTEPLLEVPVKVHFAGRSEDDVLVGLAPESVLKKLFSTNGKPLQLPKEGLLINEKTANKLGIGVGDKVEIETLLGLGPSRHAEVTVVGVSRQLIGGGSYIPLFQVNRILGEEGLISGAMLKVDPGKVSEVEGVLNKMTAVASILSKQKEIDNFNTSLEATVYSVGIMILCAVLLGFAIVYNASVISFAERKRELASLRVLGFTIKEVSALLWKEYLLQSLCGIALGLPFGYLMALSFARSLSTDLFSLPVVVYPITYVFAALGGIAFVMIALRFAVRGVRKLDLVEILKNRD